MEQITKLNLVKVKRSSGDIYSPEKISLWEANNRLQDAIQALNAKRDDGRLLECIDNMAYHLLNRYEVELPGDKKAEDSIIRHIHKLLRTSDDFGEFGSIVKQRNNVDLVAVQQYKELSKELKEQCLVEIVLASAMNRVLLSQQFPNPQFIELLQHFKISSYVPEEKQPTVPTMVGDFVPEQLVKPGDTVCFYLTKVNGTEDIAFKYHASFNISIQGIINHYTFSPKDRHNHYIFSPKDRQLMEQAVKNGHFQIVTPQSKIDKPQAGVTPQNRQNKQDNQYHSQQPQSNQEEEKIPLEQSTKSLQQHQSGQQRQLLTEQEWNNFPAMPDFNETFSELRVLQPKQGIGNLSKGRPQTQVQSYLTQQQNNSHIIEQKKYSSQPMFVQQFQKQQIPNPQIQGDNDSMSDSENEDNKIQKQIFMKGVNSQGQYINNEEYPKSINNSQKQSQQFQQPLNQKSQNNIYQQNQQQNQQCNPSMFNLNKIVQPNHTLRIEYTNKQPVEILSGNHTATIEKMIKQLLKQSNFASQVPFKTFEEFQGALASNQCSITIEQVQPTQRQR